LIEKETEHEVELFGGFGAREQKNQNPESENKKSENQEPGKKEPEIPGKKDGKSQSSLFDF
jgi:hypothetical protein